MYKVLPKCNDLHLTSLAMRLRNKLFNVRQKISEVDNVRLKRHSVRETREISTVIVFAGRV